jgi:flagellar assembly protein FliH
LLSDGGGLQEPRSRSSRVIKSDVVSHLSFAFPTLGGGAGDRPAAQLAEVPPALPVTHQVSRARQGTGDAELRARALERRATAVLAEAEEAAEMRIKLADEHARTTLVQAAEAAGHVREEARRQGREEGYAEGLRHGMEAARAESESVLAAAQADAEAEVAGAAQVAEQVRREALAGRAEVLDAAQGQLLDLAFAMARQILKTELTLQPGAALPMLEAALAKLKGEEEPQVRLSPQTLAVLEEHRGRLLAALPGARRIALEADPGLEPGDFVVQSNQGFVDGRVDRQVQVLESEVAAAGER